MLVVRLLMGSSSSVTSAAGAYWSRKSRIAWVVASPWPNTPSRDTMASSAGKRESTAKYVRDAARSVQSSLENSEIARLTT